jgi:hypothetical protein
MADEQLTSEVEVTAAPATDAAEMPMQETIEQPEQGPENEVVDPEIEAAQQRNREREKVESNLRRIDREIERLTSRYALDDETPAEEWAKARTAELNGTLDDLRAANSQEAQFLMMQKQAELARLGNFYAEDRAALTPSYWDGNGAARGPMSENDAVEAQISEHIELEVYQELAQQRLRDAGMTEAEVLERTAAIPEHQHPTAELASMIVRLRAPEIAFHLIDNPHIAEKLNRLSGPRLAAELGSLRSSLSQKSRSEEYPSVSRAPAPATPVRKPTSASSRSFDPNDSKLNAEQWVKARNQQLKNSK